MVRARRTSANRAPRKVGIKTRIRRELIQKRKDVNKQLREIKKRATSINSDIRSLTVRRNRR